MNKLCAVAALVVFTMSTGVALARNFNRDYTQDEQALCQPDVFRLCNDEVPDQDRIIACMQVNRTQLTPQCRKVFDAGLKTMQQQQ